MKFYLEFNDQNKKVSFFCERQNFDGLIRNFELKS